MVMLTHPPMFSEETYSEIARIVNKILLEDAESDLRLGTWLDRKYKKFKGAVSTIIQSKDLNKLYYKRHATNPVLDGFALNVQDIIYVFISKEALGNANFAIDTADTENVVYCGMLEENTNITFQELKNSISPRYENPFKHELTHIFDKLRYKGDCSNVKIATAGSKYYNHSLEFNSHFSEVFTVLNEKIDACFKSLTDNEETNLDIKAQLNKYIEGNIYLAREGYESDLFDDTIFRYVYHLNKRNYKAFLSRIYEIVELKYQNAIKNIKADKNGNQNKS